MIVSPLQSVERSRISHHRGMLTGEAAMVADIPHDLSVGVGGVAGCRPAACVGQPGFAPGTALVGMETAVRQCGADAVVVSYLGHAVMKNMLMASASDTAATN